MFMSKDNMVDICRTVHAHRRRPSPQGGGGHTGPPPEAAGVRHHAGIAEDPEFAGADTDEKNRVVVMFGERMYRNHIQASEPVALATPSEAARGAAEREGGPWRRRA
jgi:hypothetical protein